LLEQIFVFYYSSIIAIIKSRIEFRQVEVCDASKAALRSIARLKNIFYFFPVSELIHAAILRASDTGTCGIGAMGVA
jgi:hypothetical protein